MKTVFADTGYWLALVNPDDDLHQKAREVTENLSPFKVITSQMVFVECLNAFSTKGSWFKQSIIQLIQRSRNNPDIIIYPQTQELFTSAFDLYQNRLDKQWSLTDCSSFSIMQQQKIVEALAHDRHFAQAGFIPLLR
ncbi:type II toxin-antitoxin system VapC family toxin [Spirulina sp. 06S082]|uniref:type II toxin-antitoxin system VapC family toxin n=1 Tax=Spirulina sp. 06S082 TaxID=3110248 RepID=UPI002B20C8DF|nr:hypothetical protein [Spirulina sp. 06S082]MEA5468530.1 hypothetical protein [Spirulina sp. 06S082]